MHGRTQNGTLIAALAAQLCLFASTLFAANSAEPISPEAVRKLQAESAPLIFVDADAGATVPAIDAARLVIIHYSKTPSAHSAMRAAEAAAQAGAARSHWLAGTPLDWQREQLMIRDPIANAAQPIGATQLAAAIKDGAPLQLLDLRSRIQFEQGHLPGARHNMPDEIDAALAKLSKERWIILIDDGTRVAEPLAGDLYRKGFVLSAWLDGGYPAWVKETNK